MGCSWLWSAGPILANKPWGWTHNRLSQNWHLVLICLICFLVLPQSDGMHIILGLWDNSAILFVRQSSTGARNRRDYYVKVIPAPYPETRYVRFLAVSDVVIKTSDLKLLKIWNYLKILGWTRVFPMTVRSPWQPWLKYDFEIIWQQLSLEWWWWRQWWLEWWWWWW